MKVSKLDGTTPSLSGVDFINSLFNVKLLYNMQVCEVKV